MRTTLLPRPLVLSALLSLSSTACKPASTSAVPPEAAAPTPPSPYETALVSSLDPSVDPCDDFYRYACGGWLASHPIPPDKPIVNRSFDAIFDRNEELLRTVAEDAAARPGDDPDLAKVGRFYAACMDEAAIEARGAEPLAPLVAVLADLGGSGGRSRSRPNRSRILGALQHAGGDGLFSTRIEPDDRDPNIQVVTLTQRGLILGDRSFYLDEARAPVLAAYRTWLVTDLVLAGAVPSQAEAEALADAIVAFEKRVAEVSWERARMRDSEAMYNPHTLAELKALAPRIDWEAYFEAFGVGAVDRVIVATPSYFEALDDLFAEVDESTLRGFLHARLLQRYGDHLSSPFVESGFEFFGKQFSGLKQMKPRWKRCVATTGAILGEALGKAYVARAFPGESKEVAESMVAHVQGAFGRRLDGVTWMDDATRQAGKGKAAALLRKIGYPDQWLDISTLEIGDDHFANVSAGVAFEIRRQLDRLGKPTDKTEWFMTPQMVNAYYNAPFNEIVFPAGILQPPFFAAEQPAAANFGAMGMVVGHEVSHAFDDEGRKYDVDGRLNEWWTAESATAFETRAACVRDRYAEIEVQPGEHINGQLTLGENIADLGGIRVTLDAYRAWEAEHGPQPEVAGFSPEKLLYVSYAQAWCTNATPEIVRMRLLTDTHSPAEARVNVPLQNLPDFAAAFACAEGKPMNPTERCEVW